MDKFENFFGWLLRWRRSQPPTENPIKPVRCPSYRPLDDFDKLIADLKAIQADFDCMIAESERVITSLKTPRPYQTRETDNPIRLT